MIPKKKVPKNQTKKTKYIYRLGLRYFYLCCYP